MFFFVMNVKKYKRSQGHLNYNTHVDNIIFQNDWIAAMDVRNYFNTTFEKK